jgi:hypothetical protein
MRRCNAQAIEVFERALRTVDGDGSFEGTASEAQLRECFDAGSAFLDEVDSGDPCVNNAVLNVLGNVGCSHEQ